MTGLTRLMDEPGGDRLEASLLRLARSEGPSPEGRRRILAGVAAAAAATTSLVGRSADAATQSGKAASAAKWVLLGAAVVAVPAALLLQGGSGSQPAPKHLPPPSALQAPAREVKAPAPPAEAQGPAPLALEDLPLLPEPAPPSGGPAATKQGGLADEVAQLQKAKLALRSGQPVQALAELRTYAQRFPRPMLGAEAAVVRIEATHASGDAGRAKLLAESFLAKNPNSPYATRLRSLTGVK